MNIRHTEWIALALGLLLASGPLLAAGPDWPVEGLGAKARLLGESVTFGPFEATEITMGVALGKTRKAKKKELKEENEALAEGTVVLEHKKSKWRQRRGFRMLEGDRDLGRVQCVWKLQAESRVVEQGESGRFVDHPKDELVFSCFGEPSPAGGEGWILTLTASKFHTPEGTLAVSDRRFEVRGIDPVPDAPIVSRAAAYTIRHEDQTVASVRVLAPRTVWIHPDAGGREREILAAAAAALLLARLPPKGF